MVLVAQQQSIDRHVLVSAGHNESREVLFGTMPPPLE
jgi:hypothetical protein